MGITPGMHNTLDFHLTKNYIRITNKELHKNSYLYSELPNKCGITIIYFWENLSA